MKFFKRWFRRKASPPYDDPSFNINNPTAWMYGGSNLSGTGQVVTLRTAMGLSAFWASTRVISEGISQLPLPIYRRQPRGKERAPEHPLYKLFHDAANENQTAIEFRDMVQMALLTRGVSYAFKVFNLAGEVDELVPIEHERVEVEWTRSGAPLFHVQPPSNEPGARRTYTTERIWFMRGMTLDGKSGVSPLAYHRETFGQGLALQQHGSRFFANGARPGGVLLYPSQLDPKARANIENSWREGFTGDNAYRTAILEEGVKYQQLGISNDDAQYLESRKFSRAEIASIFRVPPHMIGEMDRATFSNIEHQGLEFVTYTLLPWARRWEQSIKKDLLAASDEYFAEHVFDALLRGDTKTRYDAYRVARETGWMSVNEIRELENRNPIDEGDGYIEPMNFKPLGSEPASSDEPRPAEEDDEGAAKILSIGSKSKRSKKEN